VRRFEDLPAPDPLVMFDHAYGELPPHLVVQRQEVAERQPGAPKADPEQPAAPMRGQRLTRR
jgi:hypothetical protein